MEVRQGTVHQVCTYSYSYYLQDLEEQKRTSDYRYSKSYYINPRLTDCIYLFVCLFVRSGAYVRYLRGPEAAGGG